MCWCGVKKLLTRSFICLLQRYQHRMQNVSHNKCSNRGKACTVDHVRGDPISTQLHWDTYHAILRYRRFNDNDIKVKISESMYISVKNTSYGPCYTLFGVKWTIVTHCYLICYPEDIRWMCKSVGITSVVCAALSDLVTHLTVSHHSEIFCLVASHDAAG